MEFNEWFLSKLEECPGILMDKRCALAEAAFNDGKVSNNHDKNKIIKEIKTKIKNLNVGIKNSGDSHFWRTAYELTIQRDTLINLLSTIGEL